MSHDALQEKLLDLAYGELSRREARKVEVHAAACDECGARLARIRETRRLMGALPPKAAPERGENVLLAAARERSRLREPRWRIPRWLVGASVAASFVAVGALSYQILAMRPGPLGRFEHDALLGKARPAQAAPEAATSPAPAPSTPAPADEGSARVAAAPLPPVRRGDVGEKRKGAEPFRDRAIGNAGAAPAAPRPYAEPPPREASRGSAAMRDESFTPRAELGSTAPEEHGADAAKREEAPDARASAAPLAKAAPEREAPDERAAPAAPPAKAVRERSPAQAVSPPRAAAPLGYGEEHEKREEAPPVAHRRATAPGAAAPPAEPAEDDAVARWQSLRASGKLRAEVRTFSGCDPDVARFTESFRKLERDPQGRVVRFEMRGFTEGTPYQAEGFYDAAGVLRVERWRYEGGEVTERRHPASGPATTRLPAHASAARMDAPGRCER